MNKTAFRKGNKGFKGGASALLATAVILSGSISPTNVFADKVTKSAEEVIKAEVVRAANKSAFNIEHGSINTRYVDNKKVSLGVSLNIEVTDKTKKSKDSLYETMKDNLVDLTNLTSNEDLTSFFIDYSIENKEYDIDKGNSYVDGGQSCFVLNLDEVNIKKITNTKVKKDIESLKTKYKSILLADDYCEECFNNNYTEHEDKYEYIIGLTKDNKIEKLNLKNTESLDKAMTKMIPDISEVYDHKYSLIKDNYFVQDNSIKDSNFVYINIFKGFKPLYKSTAKKYAKKLNIDLLNAKYVDINGESL